MYALNFWPTLLGLCKGGAKAYKADKGRNRGEEGKVRIQLKDKEGEANEKIKDATLRKLGEYLGTLNGLQRHLNGIVEDQKTLCRWCEEARKEGRSGVLIDGDHYTVEWMDAKSKRDVQKRLCVFAHGMREQKDQGAQREQRRRRK